jgi:hypothetical protein
MDFEIMYDKAIDKIEQLEADKARLLSILNSIFITGEMQMGDDIEQHYVEVSKTYIREAKKLIKEMKGYDV